MFCVLCVPAQLERSLGIILDPHGRLLHLNDKLPDTTDPERVVEKGGRPANPDRFSQHYFPVRFRSSLVVVHVVAQRNKERINEILPELRLVVFLLPAKVRVAVECVSFDKRLDRYGNCHWMIMICARD